jgi:glycosyltransferase involved in cell wall biosynthesis
LREWATRRYIEALDRAASWAIEPCDVFIGMSGLFGRTATSARRKFGAKVWVERGSRHILSQRVILASLPGAEQVPDYAVRREVADYDRADVVSVLSRHCEQSFLDYGFPADKLVRNPLGVNLASFRGTPAPPPRPPTVLMAGSWSLRKGCDVLTAAWQQLPSVKLVHVGPVVDCPLPSAPNFVHHDKVDQTELSRFYAAAHVFALASHEEGLATVQPQALSCGLRLVCTDRTGGEDLREFVADPSAIRVVPTSDPDKMAVALADSLADAAADVGIRDRLGDLGRTQLSWAAYAERYEAALFERL